MIANIIWGPFWVVFGLCNVTFETMKINIKHYFDNNNWSSAYWIRVFAAIKNKVHTLTKQRLKILYSALKNI